jgi:hypothetical protein
MSLFMRFEMVRAMRNVKYLLFLVRREAGYGSSR